MVGWETRDICNPPPAPAVQPYSDHLSLSGVPRFTSLLQSTRKVLQSTRKVLQSTRKILQSTRKVLQFTFYDQNRCYVFPW